MSWPSRLRNITATLKKVARSVRFEHARRGTSISQRLSEILKRRFSASNPSAHGAADRLANFGKRHNLSLRRLKIKDLINEGRR
jgi:hypothetical protein